MRGRFTLLLLFALTACSPAQEAAWRDWFTVQPRAAVAFATEACGALCTDDWDHDGIVEPEPDVQSETANATNGWTDITIPGVADGQCGQWYGTALVAGWSESDWPTVARIMAAESGCNPDAWNPEEHFGGHASGLMQVIWPTWAAECGDGDIFDPWFNLRCALYLKETYGWSQWVTW